ncbi:helix-turn-helix domain-containing protein [Tsukamurella sp. 1534]|uniref:helix-turn-helix domain-containing protein n=1 Tax=Tsukamurella sp. 1534 TaxID=1151061 RepID=UPI0009DA01F1|nr:helix-turn-helix transcriptional regulator [Tsukamurella sp. 1534]
MSGPEIDWETYGHALARRLVVLRKARGYSQERLAQLAGMHRNQISNIERNVSSNERYADPHMSTVYRLAAALSVAPSFLLPDVGVCVQMRSSEQESEESAGAVESAVRAGMGPVVYVATHDAFEVSTHDAPGAAAPDPVETAVPEGVGAE